MMEIDTLVFSGGGVNGLTFIGCVKALEEYNKAECICWAVNEFCGISAGSMIAFLLSIGYTGVELEDIVVEKDFQRLLKIQIINMYNFGMDKGDRILEWMESLLLRKLNKHRDVTFKDLFDVTKKKLTIMAANVNKNVLRVFNVDYTPNAKVLDILRMSIGIPFLFTKCEYEGEIYVDGGLIQPYPVTWYPKARLPKLLGFKISWSDVTSTIIKNISFVGYISRILSCYNENRTNKDILPYEYDNRTIEIPKLLTLMDISITTDKKRECINTGYDLFRREFETRFLLSKVEEVVDL